MKLSTNKKINLAYLEQDIDTNVMEEDLDTLKENDVFKEYLNNMDGSIYNAISRLVQAKKLPMQTIIINSNDVENKFYELPKECYEVKEINLVTDNGLNANIFYQIIGNRIFFPRMNKNETYIIAYYPRFLYFDDYLEIDSLDDINDLDLAKHGLPDELAITIRYAVYGDMKSEENPSVAANNRNYFEAILSDNNKIDVFTHQPKVNGDGDKWQLD